MKVGVSGKQPENSFPCNSMEQRLCPRDGRGHRDHTGKETNPSIIGGCKSHFAVCCRRESLLPGSGIAHMGHLQVKQQNFCELPNTTCHEGSTLAM